MKIIRWLMGLFTLFLVLALLSGSPPVRAATTGYASCQSDEHPWDFLKNAYRVEMLITTSDYIIFAVWYTKEQIQPTLIRIDLRSESSSPSNKAVAKKSYRYTE